MTIIGIDMAIIGQVQHEAERARLSGKAIPKRFALVQIHTATVT